MVQVNYLYGSKETEEITDFIQVLSGFFKNDASIIQADVFGNLLVTKLELNSSWTKKIEYAALNKIFDSNQVKFVFESSKVIRVDYTLSKAFPIYVEELYQASEFKDRPISDNQILLGLDSNKKMQFIDLNTVNKIAIQGQVATGKTSLLTRMIEEAIVANPIAKFLIFAPNPEDYKNFIKKDCVWGDKILTEAKEFSKALKNLNHSDITVVIDGGNFAFELIDWHDEQVIQKLMFMLDKVWVSIGSVDHLQKEAFNFVNSFNVKICFRLYNKEDSLLFIKNSNSIKLGKYDDVFVVDQIHGTFERVQLPRKKPMTIAELKEESKVNS